MYRGTSIGSQLIQQYLVAGCGLPQKNGSQAPERPDYSFTIHNSQFTIKDVHANYS